MRVSTTAGMNQTCCLQLRAGWRAQPRELPPPARLKYAWTLLRTCRTLRASAWDRVASERRQALCFSLWATVWLELRVLMPASAGI